MRKLKIRLACLVLVSLVLQVPVYGGEAKKLSFHNLRIVFKSTIKAVDPDGNPTFNQTQEITRLVDVRNNRQRIETVSENNTQGVSYKNTQVVIIDSEFVHTLNEENKIFYSGAHKSSEGPVWMDAPAPEDRFLSEEKFLNRNCRIYQLDNGTIWVWEGIILKRMGKMGPVDQKLEAQKIEIDPHLPDSLFVVPKDYTQKLIDPAVRPGNLNGGPF